MDKLKEKLIESINSFEEWREEPANPVLEYKPKDAFVAISEFKQLQNELNEKEEILKESVSKVEYIAIEKELLKLKQQQEKMVEREQLNDLQKELGEKEKKITKLNDELERVRSKQATSVLPPQFILRSKAIKYLSESNVKEMIIEKNFYDRDLNKNGKGINHNYIKDRNGEIIYDLETGLVWQQSGSDGYKNYKNAKNYIKRLNIDQFVGYHDWRLPTLEEAISLIQPFRSKNGLYIDPIFSGLQRWIWTSNNYSNNSAWVVSFSKGFCEFNRMVTFIYIRAVRSA